MPGSMHGARLGLVAALAVCLSISPLGVVFAARDGDGVHQHAQGVRTSTPPRIDGRLDDASWASAPEQGDFHQNTPREGAPASQATRFRVLYDDSAVYVGIRCDDTAPELIRASLARRDGMNETDTIWVQIDSQHDHASGFAFALTAAGVQLDARMYDDDEFSFDWDAVWEGEVTRDATGWSAELAIPLRVLRFDATQASAWGFNVLRYLPRTQEDSSWVWWPATSLDARVSRFGHLEGLERLRPRRTLELRPFVVTRLAGESPGGGVLGSSGGATETQVDAGLDLKLGLSSDLTFDATVFPDFGQVEADPDVLNLSQFENFFTERRPFFVEASDLFQTPVQLFYTRRIGQGSAYESGDSLGGRPLASDPSPPRILTAAKISGKATRRLSIGVLAALTGAEEADQRLADGTRAPLVITPSRGFGVARARYGIGTGGSFIGAAATGVTRVTDDVGRAAVDHDAYAQALDLVLRSENGRLSLTTQGVVAERVGGPTEQARDGGPCPGPSAPCVPLARADGTPRGPGQVGAGGVATLAYQGPRLFGDLIGQSHSPTLELNDAGFVQDSNRHFLRASGGVRETQGKGRLQNYGLATFHVGAFRWDGLPLYAYSGLNPWLTTRGFLHMWADFGMRYVPGWDPHDAGDGARARRTEDLFVNLGIQTNQARAVSFGATFNGKRRFGEAYSVGGEASMTVRTGGALELQLEGDLRFDPDWPRFYSCQDEDALACSTASTDRTYVWADLDSAFGSVTARLAWTFSTRLSLQTYAQLFTAMGSWDHFRGARVTGTRPALRPDTFTPLAFDGDADRDGVVDRAFTEATLNLNVVVRWEPVRGSALIGVYTRAQEQPALDAGATPALGFDGLGSGKAVDVVLLKLVLFVS